MHSPRLNQIAMSVTNLPRTHAWYQAAFGYVPAAGTNSFKGYLAEKIQGVPGARSTCWWLVDQQDFFQLELFQFHRPEVRPLPADWRPCDIGYNMLGIHVSDFDLTLSRLASLGSPLLTAPLGASGERRVCVRDPEGVLLELLECDPREGKNSPPARPDIAVSSCSITASVPDLEKSVQFFVGILGLAIADDVQLHHPAHEQLWGLAGATRKTVLLWAGDVLLELVQYLDPPGRAPAADYRVSDQGLLNIALGFRDRQQFTAVYQRCVAAGVKANWRPVHLGAWSVVYVNDEQGFSVELLYVAPWYDGRMGFRAKPDWPEIPVNGTQQLLVQQSIKASPEQVWQHISEHENMPQWWPLDKVSLLAEGTPERNGSGARRQLQGFNLQVEETVLDWLPPHRYSYQLTCGAPLKQHVGEVQLVPNGTSTTVLWRIEFKPRLPLTGWLCQRLLRALIRTVLQRLARLIESGGPTTIAAGK